MMNYIWAGMIVIALIAASFMGTMDATIKEALNAASGAIGVVLGFTGVMCLWSGFLKIAEHGGLIEILRKLLKPVLRLLFPEAARHTKAASAILSNITANFLGMGNAATPFGIRAMQELDEINGHNPSASNAMCMFVVLNTASIQLIPSSIIAIRASAGAANPFDIMVPIWITSAISLVSGIIMCRLLQRRQK